MTGPEHYKLAEALISPGVYDEAGEEALLARDIARAQVHATLAAADAQARLADFVDRLGQVAVHTVFAGMGEQDVEAAQERVRQILGMPAAADSGAGA